MNLLSEIDVRQCNCVASLWDCRTNNPCSVCSCAADGCSMGSYEIESPRTREIVSTFRYNASTYQFLAWILDLPNSKINIFFANIS